MQLNNDNIEEYILLLADHELSGQEESEVRQYIAQHEAYKPMLDAYLAARLDEDKTPYIFTDKESLLKPEAAVLPMKRNTSPLRIAAALVVLIGVGAALMLLFSRDDVKDTQSNESLQASRKNSANTVVSPVRTIADSPKSAAVIKPKMNMMKSNIVPQKLKHSNNTQTIVVNTSGRNTAAVPAYLENEALNKVEVSAGETAQAVVMETNEAAEIPQQEGRSIPKWLPVNEENLQGINSLIDHIQSLKEGIQEKAQTLKNKAFVINIGDRQFSIGK
jgi:hypothetical protein